MNKDYSRKSHKKSSPQKVCYKNTIERNRQHIHTHARAAIILKKKGSVGKK